LFWKGNSITSEREYASVSSIFDSAGIQVKCCSDSKEEFLNEMKHNYDIVWISSHGEHEHYDPVNSKIVLSDEQNILLSDFERMKNLNKDTTRLIFSNTCEGSKSAQTGELLNIGFPYLLTDSNQDFLSHLWMVNFQIAPIYASLYAIHISEGESFFTAYQNTVKDLLEGKDRVLEILGTAGNLSPVQELAESLSNIDSIDFSNILTWGSSAYYT